MYMESDPKGQSAGRTRAFLRKLLFFPLTRLIVALLFLYAGYLLHLILSHQLAIPRDATVLGEISLVIFIVGAYVAYVRLIERRPVRELLPGKAPKELGLGMAIGGGIITVIVGILWVFGIWQVDAQNPWSVIAIPLVTAAATAIWEEVVFRGIVFRVVEEGLGTWLALVISALTFGLLHFGNEDATMISVLTITVTAGPFLASVYILTRRLWLAIGAHYAVNVFQGPVFGLPVSGEEKIGRLQSSLEGPEFLTGGAFGIEASLVTAVIVIAVVTCVLKTAYSRGKFVSPLWRSSRGLSDGGILPELK